MERWRYWKSGWWRGGVRMGILRFAMLWGLFGMSAFVSACSGHPNLIAPTLGGKQYWVDEWIGSEWRIQRNVLSGHHRLLNPNDWRFAWGSFEHCKRQFEARRERGLVDPESGARHLVVLLHGALRSNDAMDPVASELRDAGFRVMNVNYPSRITDIPDDCAQIERLLAQVEDVDEVSFVTHSYGALIARIFVAGHPRVTTADGSARLARLCMIFPPNQGSALAERFQHDWWYHWLYGPAHSYFTKRGVARVPRPTIPFAIIAGGRGDAEGWNPWIPGDDDGVVGVAEARLEGSDDFAVLPVVHTFGMNDPRVLRRVVRYLRSGSFD